MVGYCMVGYKYEGAGMREVLMHGLYLYSLPGITQSMC